MLEQRSRQVLTLGDSLLYFLEQNFQNSTKMLTYNVTQFIWIMNRGTPELKVNVLICWLQNGDLDVLVRELARDKYCLILFDCLMKEDLNESVSRR